MIVSIFHLLDQFNLILIEYHLFQVNFHLFRFKSIYTYLVKYQSKFQII
jgi:hypothetical protein